MKSLLTLSAILFSVSAFSMDNCPVAVSNSNYIAKVVSLTAKTSSCEEASELATVCALGTSGDVEIVNAAIKRCEKGVVMTKTDKSVYEYLSNKCDQKYSSQAGSMYTSFTAFCKLSVTNLFINLL